MIRVHAEVHGETVRVESNLGDLDACHHEPVLAALAKSVGIGVPMEKGGGPEGEDPRFPELWRLARSAREDWTRWGRQLVLEVERLLREGRLLPLTPANEHFLQELLREHATGIVLRMTGRGAAAAEKARLVDRGLVSPDVEDVNWLTASFEAGRRLDMLAALEIGRGGGAVRSAVEALARPGTHQGEVPLTPRDRAAREYVARRGAVFMRRPAERATSEAERILTEAEYDAVRGAIGDGVGRRWSATRVARELRDAVEGTTLTNDMDRVARTEMVFAHNHGAFVALKGQAERAGLKDPEVYKMVAPRACAHCRRIWGSPGKPTVYRLSEVEQREAAGGNFRLPAAQWGPVIGPVHPNCTEGPLQLWHPALSSAIEAVAARILARG